MFFIVFDQFIFMNLELPSTSDHNFLYTYGEKKHKLEKDETADSEAAVADSSSMLTSSGLKELEK